MSTYEEDSQKFKNGDIAIYYRGYLGYIKQNDLGALCGYVTVPKRHMDVMKDDDNFYVHGGVTYTGDQIFNVEALGDNHNKVTVIGFDCAHAGDAMPKMEKELSKIRKLIGINDIPEMYSFYSQQVYRDIDYVKNQIKSMIDQIVDKYDKD